jgi:hypothetical protein
VPVNQGEEKKKRNDSLKHKARLMSGNHRSANPSYLSFGREDTFLTGGGLPGRRSKEDNEEDDDE